MRQLVMESGIVVEQRTALLIEVMQGLGDSIYQRAFIRAACEREDVYLRTPWPELYEDLPVRFVKMRTPLRTQQKNIDRQRDDRWADIEQECRTVTVHYGSAELTRGSAVQAMERCLPLHGAPLVMDLPAFGSPPVRSEKPLVLVRPVTLRQEWVNIARNPLPEYIAAMAATLMDTHHVVSVADCVPGYEHIVPPAPPAHIAFHAGELDVTQLLALAQHAALILGGVGWIVPAAIAAHVPAFVVLGGCGGHNAPELITDPRMDLSRIGWAIPDRFCRCQQLLHTGCDKRISDPLGQFERWRRGLGL